MLPFEKQDIADYSALLVASFAKLTGGSLLEPGDSLSRRLYEAPFALVSHGMQKDPVFRYANKTALSLWKMTWDEFTAMPSRLSAEPVFQEERQRLLDETRRKGYTDSYEGIRIAKDGQRFRIRDTVLWNVIDAAGIQHGQACVIYQWENL